MAMVGWRRINELHTLAWCLTGGYRVWNEDLNSSVAAEWLQGQPFSYLVDALKRGVLYHAESEKDELL